MRAATCALAVGVLLAGCASAPSRSAITDPRALERLGFLSQERVTRETVEARLGVPTTRYEGGRIVGYAVYGDENGLRTTPGKGDCYALIIVYSADGSVARRALVRRPCAARG